MVAIVATMAITCTVFAAFNDQKQWVIPLNRNITVDEDDIFDSRAYKNIAFTAKYSHYGVLNVSKVIDSGK